MYTVSTIITETSSDNFDLVKYRAFLEHHGVYNQGAWRTECRLQDKTEIPSQYGRYTWVPASDQALCWGHLFASSKIISLYFMLSIPLICQSSRPRSLINILNPAGNYVYISILCIFCMNSVYSIVQEPLSTPCRDRQESPPKNTKKRRCHQM